MDDLAIRPVRADEWREVRALRLSALQDADAAIAFLDSYDDAASRPDEFWQQRTAAASIEAGADAVARQFVAVTAEGAWVGTLAVLVERAGERDFEGVEIRRPAGGIVGVYVDPEFRGRGVIQPLFDAALDWVRERGLDYARLYVHSDNSRARRAYERAGFRPTGVTLAGSIGLELELAREV